MMRRFSASNTVLLIICLMYLSGSVDAPRRASVGKSN
jgi:hypothetical protein